MNQLESHIAKLEEENKNIVDKAGASKCQEN